jgi:DNA-binding CsgD family transcriptional regulator
MGQSSSIKLVTDLTQWRLFPHKLREELLNGLLQLVQAGGPCTLLQLNRFFSEGGKRIGEHHVRRPPRYKLLLWLPHIRAGQSEIERRIYDNRQSDYYGVSRLYDVFTQEEWRACPQFKIAEKCNVSDIAYVWVRCSANDLWIACLRRSKQEPPFSIEERLLLCEFASEFYELKQFWYKDDLQKLSKREQEVLHHTAAGLTADRVGRLLNISKRTVEAQLTSARRKLQTKNTRELIARGLGMPRDL